ncbi:hypothetical protein [Flavobacterium notoginsengisoli]|uniref:hypothetical protein n=1 Tax=Flavobacterium notoginsengisoli TaxID=1478199 RepID=UPI003645C981
MKKRRVLSFALSFIIITLAVLRVTFGIIRFVNYHSHKNDIKKPFLDISPYVMTLEEAERRTQQHLVDIKKARDTISNTILYLDYNSLDKMSFVDKRNYGLNKVKNDSILFIDFNTQLKIPKDYYSKESYNDSLRAAFKSVEDLNVFIYTFKAQGNVERNFKSLKTKNDLKNYRQEDIVINDEGISYKMSEKNKQFRGYVFYFHNKKEESLTFFEFESNKLSGKELKIKAFEFLAENLKQKK